MALFFLVLALLSYTVQAVPVHHGPRAQEEKSSVTKAVASISRGNNHLPIQLVREIEEFAEDIQKTLMIPLDTVKFLVDSDYDEYGDSEECYNRMVVQLVPDNLEIPKSSKPVSAPNVSPATNPLIPTTLPKVTPTRK